MLFRNWLTGAMGTPGDYSYSPMHLWTVVVVLAATIAVAFFGYKNRNHPRRSRFMLVAISLFQLTFEIGWRLIYLFVNDASAASLWPMYPCNLGGILIPVIALCKLQRLKKLFYVFGFVGGVITFAIPDGIFSTDVLVFPILKSILQHTGLLLIPTLEYTSGSYRASLRDLSWIVGGSLIHVVNCEIIVRFMGLTGDYMFFRSGLPFVIPGVPQFITLTTVALSIFILLCYISDKKASKDFLEQHHLLRRRSVMPAK